MRTALVASLLVLVSLPVFACPARAQLDDPAAAEVPPRLVDAAMAAKLRAAAGKLRTKSTAVNETTWVGHSFDASHWSATNNYWNIYVGTNAPGTNNPSNALWDWDHTAGYGAVVNDSLQGWWPARRTYSITGGLTLPDKSRPWWAIDVGNVANYVLNQGQNKRTLGVVGVWHRDPGNNGAAGNAFGAPVRWAPLAGSFSAWCGLRGHGDLTAVDDIASGREGNPFNQDAMEFSGDYIGSQSTGTSQGFPGYASQWDQMLYRDVTVANGSDLNLSFLYRTRMSTGANPNAATKTGIFYKDPKSLGTGNFISASDASVAIVDSFMVYVGGPVNDAACVYSDGTNDAVFDPRRRWFSEVIRCNEAGVQWYEIFSAAGNNPADSASATPGVSVNIPNSQLQPILTASGGVARIVFRVKTNRGFDDEYSANAGGVTYTSTGRGAAIIDNVVANGDTIGDFEHASGVDAIDNRTGASPLNNWKSTGKPPGIFWHPHALANLVYDDICGPPNSPSRFCNLAGVVISAGDHDRSEAAGGIYGTAGQELSDGMISPTINLVAPGPSTPNAMGITGDMAVVTDDYYIYYEIYTGIFDVFTQGNFWQFGVQCYPSKQTVNGIVGWGQVRTSSFPIFNAAHECFSDIECLMCNGIVRTSNASGVPDSMRIYLGKTQECFRFAISLGCSPTDGAYFDNVALAMVDIPTTLAARSAVALPTPGADIWQWINDTFPANETQGLPGTTGFDTCAALVKNGGNNALNTPPRFDVPGDSTVVREFASNLRVDLVFRILPGVGNYVTIGNKASGLRRVPTSRTAAVPNAASSNFWESYLGDNGAFGTPGGHPGGMWNQNVWNSARCDTAEINLFPVAARGNLPSLVPGYWASMYHDADPKFSALGIVKNRCFLSDTAGAAINSTNITCSTVPAWATTVPQSRTGYDGNQTTREYTKIIPDGQLTPGASVQYFFRFSDLSAPTAFVSVPDTDFVLPQTGENSTDRHRWQSFGVLPDRWKDPAFNAGGLGMACILYVDWDDRRGNEGVWMGVADSIGLTSAAKYGAQNGWHAPGNGFDYTGVRVSSDPSFAVFTNGGQPGTYFDMYGVKGSELFSDCAGSLGSRLANRSNPGLYQQGGADKFSRQGPTPEMLRAYYRLLIILTGDLHAAILGPFVYRSQDDVAILRDFLSNGSPPNTQPRGIWVEGDGFAESETQTGGVDASHTALLNNDLGVLLRGQGYTGVSGFNPACLDLSPGPAVDPVGSIYSLSNTCIYSVNEVLEQSPSVPEAVPASFYQNAGTAGPYDASILKPSSVARPWVSLVDGWEIEQMASRFCQGTLGRQLYIANVLNHVFGALCAGPEGGFYPSVSVGPITGAPSQDFVRWVGNPVRSGWATVHFSLARADRVEITLFDVGGRRVRTLADRQFPAGEHELRWDGTDDSGRRLARGVYFAQARYRGRGFTDAKHIVLLK